MLSAMRIVAGSLIALAATTVACGGGGDLSGDVEVPKGYVRFSGAGVSFIHPAGWRVSQGKDPDGAPSVEVTAPGQSATPGASVIQLTVFPRASGRFESLLDQSRVVIEAVNKGKIESEDEVKLQGAERALRTRIITPPNPGRNRVEFKSTAVDAVRDNGDVVVLAAATPRGDPELDPEAVIDSFRLQGGA